MIFAIPAQSFTNWADRQLELVSMLVPKKPLNWWKNDYEYMEQNMWTANEVVNESEFVP